MRTQVTRILGMLSFLVGLIFFIQPSFTGFVVARDISNLGDFIGIIFVLVGIVLVGMARKEIGDIEGCVVTDRFRKKTRGLDLARIEAAIEKAKKGLGRPKQLTYIGGHGQYSAHVTKGGRILYRPRGEELILEDYVPDHY